MTAPLPRACALPHAASRGASATARTLGLSVLERGWLSANQAVFAADEDSGAAVVDTGFCAHAPQTLALVELALGGEPLVRILNTHLHSDHCGGNRALQARGGVETWVPAASFAAAQSWDEDSLSYRLTDQPCPRFRADHALVPGRTLRLGPADWEIHAAPGHDMDAILLFEPQTRTLIAGDALWERRLAIIFPELVGADGFGPARRTLDLIERLAPREVVPGHGQPFEDVDAALASSRQRIAAFERSPDLHARHAARALLMFHLMEVGSGTSDELVAWMLRTPVFRAVAAGAGLGDSGTSAWAGSLLRRLGFPFREG